MQTQPDLFASAGRKSADFVKDVPAEIVDKFEELALQLRRQGFKQYSARAIMHRLRRHYHVDKGDREFVFNNNWTPALSRWFMSAHGCPEFFETRASPRKREDD